MPRPVGSRACPSLRSSEQEVVVGAAGRGGHLATPETVPVISVPLQSGWHLHSETQARGGPGPRRTLPLRVDGQTSWLADSSLAA